MEKEELTQLFNFFREIDKEKFIGRQTYLTDGVRKENDAEHAWHMAIMTVLLAGYANEKIDVLKTVTMLVQTAEKPEDIDARHAQEQMEYAEEKLRQKQSIQEYYRTQASLSRAMNRLKVSKRKKW